MMWNEKERKMNNWPVVCVVFDENLWVSLWMRRELIFSNASLLSWGLGFFFSREKQGKGYFEISLEGSRGLWWTWAIIWINWNDWFIENGSLSNFHNNSGKDTTIKQRIKYFSAYKALISISQKRSLVKVDLLAEIVEISSKNVCLSDNIGSKKLQTPLLSAWSNKEISIWTFFLRKSIKKDKPSTKLAPKTFPYSKIPNFPITGSRSNVSITHLSKWNWSNRKIHLSNAVYGLIRACPKESVSIRLHDKICVINLHVSQHIYC